MATKSPLCSDNSRMKNPVLPAKAFKHELPPELPGRDMGGDEEDGFQWRAIQVAISTESADPRRRASESGPPGRPGDFRYAQRNHRPDGENPNAFVAFSYWISRRGGGGGGGGGGGVFFFFFPPPP